MTPKAAARIQSAVDRHGGDAGFKARAMAAAAKKGGSGSNTGGSSGVGSGGEK